MGLLSFVKRNKKDASIESRSQSSSPPSSPLLRLPSSEQVTPVSIRSPIADTFMSSQREKRESSYSLMDDIWKELSPTAVLDVVPVPVKLPAAPVTSVADHRSPSPRVSSPSRPPPSQPPILPSLNPSKALPLKAPQKPLVKNDILDSDASDNEDGQNIRPIMSQKKKTFDKVKSKHSSMPISVSMSGHYPQYPQQLSQQLPQVLQAPPMNSKVLMDRMKERHRQEYRLTVHPSLELHGSSPSMPNLYHMAEPPVYARSALSHSKSFGRLPLQQNHLIQSPSIPMDMYRQPQLQIQSDILPIRPMVNGHALYKDRLHSSELLMNHSKLHRSKSAYPSTHQDMHSNGQHPLVNFEPSEPLPTPPPPNPTPITGENTPLPPLAHVKPLLTNKKHSASLQTKKLPLTPPEWNPPAPKHTVSGHSNTSECGIHSNTHHPSPVLHATHISEDPAEHPREHIREHTSDLSSKDTTEISTEMSHKPSNAVSNALSTEISTEHGSVQSCEHPTEPHTVPLLTQPQSLCRLSALPTSIRQELGGMRLHKSHYSVPDLSALSRTGRDDNTLPDPLDMPLDRQEAEPTTDQKNRSAPAPHGCHHRHHPPTCRPVHCCASYAHSSSRVCQHALTRVDREKETRRVHTSASNSTHSCKKHHHHHHHHHHHYPLVPVSNHCHSQVCSQLPAPFVHSIK
ncbi:hypothetical protein BDF14DRAFT_287645 [Spinellus fusiger]|nr:hypothetical protein BDF14DRAFT_287645 [Spinellus fusiger]